MENHIERRSSCQRQRVVLFPMPFQGHINPMLQLANILYSKGFSITVIHTNFNSSYKSNYPHFTFRPVLDNDPKDNNLAKLASKGIGDLLLGIMLLNQCGADSLHRELEQMFVASKQQHEPIGYFNQADSVFYEENIMSPDNTSNFKKTKSSEPVLNLEERVPEIPLLKVKDVIKMRIKGQEDPTGKLLANMLKQTKASSGIIWNSFTELEEPELKKILQYFSVPCFLIGPFHKCFPASSSSLFEPDRSSMSWLDHQSPCSVLYISFGSTAQLEEQQFLEVAHGLADSKQPFLWVMRPGFIKGLEGTEPLPKWFLDLVGERGRIVKWAPQPEVLAHKAIGAFWTHNGWNSTLESICEGVPMICSPFWGDQPLDARYVSDVLKIGIYLENGWAREEIASAIRRVMVEEERDEIKKRTKCLKEKVNSSLSKGGSSYESLETLIGYISSF